MTTMTPKHVWILVKDGKPLLGLLDIPVSYASALEAMADCPDGYEVEKRPYMWLATGGES